MLDLFSNPNQKAKRKKTRKIAKLEMTISEGEGAKSTYLNSNAIARKFNEGVAGPKGALSLEGRI
jgi:hypothetical protein